MKQWTCAMLDLQEFILDGHSASQLIHQLHDNLMTDDSLSDKQKSIVFERLAVNTYFHVYFKYWFRCRQRSLKAYLETRSTLDNCTKSNVFQ